MARTAVCARGLALLVFVAGVSALTMDKEATSEVISAAESARNGGEVVILVRGPHGKSARREELLHAKGEDDAAISLFYNRKTNKVTLESLNNGHLKSVSWGLGNHPRRTLLMVMTSTRVKLFVGCHPLHWHEMSDTYDLLKILTSQKLKLYHEENAPVEVYGSEKVALDSLSCNLQQASMRPPSLLTVDEPETDVEEVKDFLAKDARRKREEEMLGDDPTNYLDTNGILPQPARGDIPSSGIESCDDEVIRQLTLLRRTIEQLLHEVGEQKRTIDSLRGQLQMCCNRAPVQPPVDRCTGSSCYTGY